MRIVVFFVVFLRREAEDDVGVFRTDGIGSYEGSQGKEFDGGGGGGHRELSVVVCFEGALEDVDLCRVKGRRRSCMYTS